MKNFTKKFTLIELLTVMIIIGVILSLTLTGLERLTSAEALNMGASRLRNAMLDARTRAMVDGRNKSTRMVAVLLPHARSIRGEVNPSNSYRLCWVREVTPTEYEFDGWIPGQEWQSLGSNIVIAGNSPTGHRPYNPYVFTKQDYYTVDTRENVLGYFENSSPSANAKPITPLGEDDVFVKPKDSFNYETGFNASPEESPRDAGLITDVPDIGGDTFDVPGVIFNRFGNVVNGVNLCLVLAEGHRIYPKGIAEETPYFQFRNTFSQDGDVLLGNWIEISFNIFSGMPNIRRMGEAAPVVH